MAYAKGGGGSQPTPPSGVARIFERGAGHNFHIFSSKSFFGRTTIKLIEKQERSLGGSEGLLPRKFFENLHGVVAILMLFE